MPGVSPTLVLVLRKLGRTDSRSLLKLAVKELVARDVLRVETEERRRLGRSRGPKVFLVDGPGPAPPSRALQVAHRHVQAAPSAVRDGRVARELTVVAKHLARRRAGGEVLAAAVVDLTGMGLVREEERRVLGVFRRRLPVRTPGGDALLEQDDGRRRATSAGPADAAYVPFVVDGGAVPYDGRDLDERSGGGLDGALDPAFDGSFDSAFDSSFDAAFDASFDSAFDSGFSDGGGGGGDGGGGGGDGGGGGGD